jgi:4-cresol dehydrogenase (hydroxylating)
MTSPTLWDKILSSEKIILGEELKNYSRSTGFSEALPLAVLRPTSVSEVQQIVEVANQNQILVYPISRGQNWGYGDACAPSAGQVILDLRNMNRIIEVNEELGYVVLEPGVTQAQLWEHLKEKNISLWMDSTGAGPGASLVGNIADRGFGHTKYGDHFINTCGMEVVLASGKILNTGFGHYKNSRAKYVYRYGVGPILDGLFSQSNFGIITRVGIWLMPRPESFSAFFFLAPQDHDLEKIIEVLSPLKRQGILQSAVHIANDLRTLSGKMSYPWERANGEVPLPTKLRENLRKELGIGAWNGCGSITGTPAMVKAIEKEIKRALKNYHPIFLNDKKLKWAQALSKILKKLNIGLSLASKIEVVGPVFEMLKGVPVSEPLRGASWRVRKIDEGKLDHPLEQGAGLVWVSPILPMTGKDARELTDILKPIYNKYGFDFLATFTLLTERSMCCVTNISFDKKRPEEVENAKICYKELVKNMMDAGFIPYRTGPGGFDSLSEGSEVFWDTVSQIKTALDPQGIISPGRYQPKKNNFT